MKRIVTPEEVWASIKELTEAQKASREEWDRRHQEYDREQKERDRAFEQQKKEWDRKFEQERQESIHRQKERDLEYEKLRISGEKVDKQIAKTSKSIARLEKLFSGQ